MQGLWQMTFRGPSDSVKKLNDAVFALGNDEEYKYIVEDWRFCLDQMDALQEDGDSAELRINTESSCNITGMDAAFREFVDFAPELEAAYAERGLDNDDYYRVLYSKPGGSGKEAVEFSLSYYRGGTRIHITPDGWKCYHSNEEDGLEPEISLEDVEELRKLYLDERLEELTFQYTKYGFDENYKPVLKGKRILNSEDGRFVNDYDVDFEDGEDWCWVEDTGTGTWLFCEPGLDKEYRFVLDLLDLGC